MNYTEQFDKLYELTRLEIINKVREIGKDSKVGFKTIKIDNEWEATLPDGKIIFELGEDNVFDFYGYSYSYSALDIQELCGLADYVKIF